MARRVSAGCWERVACLGETFYRAVAEKLLADPANFGDDDCPTRAAMERIKAIVADEMTYYLLDSAVTEPDVFRRKYLQQYYDIMIRRNLPNEAGP